MKIVSKDFCTFTGVYIAIYMGPYHRSCIILVWKFQTSEMLDKWSPTFKLSHIKLSHYPDSRYIFSTCTRTHLSTIPIKLVFWYLQIFSCLILSIGWHVNYADLGVRLWLSTFRIICPRILRTGISPEFTWIFINPVCGVFFPGVFSPWPKKKRHLKKNLQKMFVQTQSI